MAADRDDSEGGAIVAADGRLLADVGANVRDARKAKAYTLAKAAELAAVSKDYLWKLETGRKNVSVVTLARLAGALGVGLQDLVVTRTSPAADPRSNSSD